MIGAYENIKAYWEHVSHEDIHAGKQAYPAYSIMLQRIADHYGMGFVQTVEAFVALSPNNDYFGNLRSLVSVIVGVLDNKPYTISTYKACGKRAETYLNGSVSFLDTVKGPKITAFRHNILYQGASTMFVLDGHMIAIALGKAMTMAEANLALQKHYYDELSAPYRRFAKHKSLAVHEMQATLWHCRKRVEGIKFSVQKDMWRDDNHLYYEVDEILPYPMKEVTT